MSIDRLPCAPSRARRWTRFIVATGLASQAFVGPTARAGDAENKVSLQAYYDFVHWVSMGRADAALEQFSDDATVVAGPNCTAQAPCVGKAAIRERYLADLLARKSGLPLNDQRFDGEVLRTRGDALDLPQHECAMRLHGGHRFELRQQRITALHVELDTSDPQTAAYAASQAESSDHASLTGPCLEAGESVPHQVPQKVR